jgi:hypothetical protein
MANSYAVPAQCMAAWSNPKSGDSHIPHTTCLRQAAGRDGLLGGSRSDRNRAARGHPVQLSTRTVESNSELPTSQVRILQRNADPCAGKISAAANFVAFLRSQCQALIS